MYFVFGEQPEFTSFQFSYFFLSSSIGLCACALLAGMAILCIVPKNSIADRCLCAISRRYEFILFVFVFVSTSTRSKYPQQGELDRTLSAAQCLNSVESVFFCTSSATTLRSIPINIEQKLLTFFFSSYFLIYLFTLIFLWPDDGRHYQVPRFSIQCV